MSLEDVFTYISSDTRRIWILDETWNRDGEWGKSDPKIYGEIASGVPQKGPKTNLFDRNTTYRFGHFRFTDFHVTWQKYVNNNSHCPNESFRGA